MVSRSSQSYYRRKMRPIDERQQSAEALVGLLAIIDGIMLGQLFNLLVIVWMINSGTMTKLLWWLIIKKKKSMIR